MGYQVGVTPLQMVAATAAVANGGRLMKPRIVARHRARRCAHGDRADRGAARHQRPHGRELTTIMEDVVTRGTGRNFAQVDGFTVAGKTGTAQKLVNGAYSHSEYNVSFAAFVPSRKPVFAIIVVIDSPRNGFYDGGAVAGPIFQKHRRDGPPAPRRAADRLPGAAGAGRPQGTAAGGRRRASRWS